MSYDVTYCFSSPDGEIILSSEDLKLPFKITPQKEHPHLTLGDYFKALTECILCHNWHWFSDRLGGKEIEKLIIRSERHGALYHIASVDLFSQGEMKRFGLCSAVTEIGKNFLRNELEIITRLNQGSRFSYLPKIYGLTAIASGHGGQSDDILVSLMEWFEGYHEWHLHESKSGSGRKQRLIIWDQQRGYRFASENEARAIYRQAAKILTLYYNPVTYQQIHPWHHAAGDFIVKTGDEIGLKLTTVRGYDSIMTLWATERVSPIIAVIYFFLNLTVRMRLDRQDGTGELIWAEERFLRPVTSGFLEGLGIKENKENSEEINKLPELLKSFNRDELEKLLYSLLPIYEKEDPEELAIIKDNLSLHAIDLHQALGKRTG